MAIRDISYFDWKYTYLGVGGTTDYFTYGFSNIYSICQDPRNLNNLCAIGRQSIPPSLDAIYFLTSSDRGNTWVIINNSATLSPDSSQHYKILMDNSGNIYANNDTDFKLYKSSDLGKTWSFLTASVASFALDNFSGNLFIANFTGGLKRSNFATPTSFSLVDNFNSNYSAGPISFYNGILSYAASSSSAGQKSILSVVRRSTDRGNVGTFSTVDTFPFTGSVSNVVGDGKITYLVQGSSSAVWSSLAANGVSSADAKSFRVRKSSNAGSSYSDYLTGSQFPKPSLTLGSPSGHRLFGCCA